MNKKTPQEAQVVSTIFRRRYSHTFFNRYVYQKQKKVIGLALQPAQAIRAFFEGRWLEWYVFMQVLNLCVERGVEFSCTRNVEMGFLNDDHRELDIVFLLNKRLPIVIECKSGEFRPAIEK